MAIQKQLKFVKETNGDVILYTLSGQLIASFNEAQTILREAGDLNRFRIVTEINDPGFLFDYRFIDSLSCFPMITENGINEFLIELSKNFFSGAKAQSGNLNLPIAFLELRLKSKGSNLCIPNKGSGIEIGDLVEGFKDANIYWESAMYKGGYKEDRNNYTPVLEHKMDYYCGTAPVVPPVVEPVVPPVVPPIVVPNISVATEDSVMCHGQINFRVNTTIAVKVNITGNFGTGGSWLGDSFLTGSNKIYAPVTEQVISSRTIYNFGIDGAQSGTYSNSSSITLELRDISTDELIASHTYTRLHSDKQC